MLSLTVNRTPSCPSCFSAYVTEKENRLCSPSILLVRSHSWLSFLLSNLKSNYSSAFFISAISLPSSENTLTSHCVGPFFILNSEVKYSQGRQHYLKGQKRCQYCFVYVKVNLKTCLCCHVGFRLSPRATKISTSSYLRCKFLESSFIGQ
jgi:hypothetical protein